MSMLEVVASEAVRVLTPGIAGVAAGALARLRHLVLGGGSLPKDRDALVAAVVRRSRDDAEFAARLVQELVAVEDVDMAASVPPAFFVDRVEARARLCKPGLHLLAGAFGTGKTALVRQVVHDIHDQIQGYAQVDLDDYRDGPVLRIVEVQQEILRQLGVPLAGDSAAVVADQYLRALVHRRIAVVFDNVVGAEEARVLAHGWPAATVLITTRVLTAELRAWCPSEPMVLRGLDDDGARELLVAKCGAAVLAAEPAAVDALIGVSAGIPAVLLQFSSRLQARRGEPGVVADLVRQLGDGGDVAGVLETSVGRSLDGLSAAAIGDLALLARFPGEDFTRLSATVWLGSSGDALLDGLIEAGLLFHGVGGRLRLLWPVRRRASALPVEAARHDEAFNRYLLWFRDMAGAADLGMDPSGVTDRARQGRLRRYPAPPVVAWPLPYLTPLDWLQGESPGVIGLLAEAHRRGRHLEVLQICGALEALLTSRGHHLLCATVNTWGIASAGAAGLPAAASRLHSLQGRISYLMGQVDRADGELRAAEELRPPDDRQLASSLLEFRAGWTLEKGRQNGTEKEARLRAEESLRAAVRIDREAGDQRALALHLRMLANVLTGAGRDREALALLTTVPVLEGDARNAARVHTVRAKAYLGLGEADAAAGELGRVRVLIGAGGATQYEIEIVDLEARLELLRGDVEAARARWGWIAGQYFRSGHPAFAHVAQRLSELPPAP
ncbi:NB-ARC domain-containing protein [Actinoplanes sp. NBRC 101535]|uniref:NB-ARC domain-containing protein n=1 Tax=Actinoplanes sp. NBRC 101535 TaxID=3032196 RepID=UPI0024A1C376|nr:NB-ARC domain-containing protein [Actinoplanes sp. NBRC 101535]GLY01137.1 hypothetical protein Acsp01_15160 [Actinoplanes sp. NBRC 101535]